MSSNFATICTDIGLPDEIYASYARRNVKYLYDWQVECLISTNVQQGGNLLYSAPTGGGKTLVAEIAMLRTVFVHGQKAILVLPYVSLVLEQIKSLRRIVYGYNRSVVPSQRIRIDGYYGDGKSTKKHTAQIMVCTIEKSNAVLNSLIGSNRIHQVGIVVIDELHVLGDKQRGYHLEILISNRSCQLVALSATMSNLQDIATWFRSDLYTTSFRPVPLKEYVCAGADLFDTSGEFLHSYKVDAKGNSQQELLLQLCEEGLRNKQQIIIFCCSRQACQTTASIIAEKISGRCTHKDVVDAEERSAASGQITEEASALRSLITHGVAFHHAGLIDTDRTSVENMFRSGIISILTATSTLAAGVNLPAGRVIVNSIRIGKDKLGSIQYKQMCGRAGRAGLTKYGESIILVKSHEKQEALSLCNSSLPAIRSQIHPSTDGGKALMRAIIELFALRLCQNSDDIEHYLRFTLLYRESTAANEEPAVTASIKETLEFLLHSKVIEKDAIATAGELKITRFGRAVFESNLTPDDAILLYDDLLASQLCLNLETCNHLMYLVTPLDHSLSVDFRHIWNCFDKSKRKGCSDVFSMLCEHVLQSSGASEALLFKWSHQPPNASIVSTNTDTLRKAVLCGRRDEYSQEFSLLKVRRLWASLALTMLLDTQSVSRVATIFNTTENDVRQLFDSCSYLAHKIFRFCREIGWLSLEKLISHMTKTLTNAFSQKFEYSHLLAIPGTTQQLARTLFDGGLRTINAIAHCDIMSLAQILQLGIQFDVKAIEAFENSLLQRNSITCDGVNEISGLASSSNLMARLTKMADALKSAAVTHLRDLSNEICTESVAVEELVSDMSSMSEMNVVSDFESESSFDDDEDMQGYMYAVQDRNIPPEDMPQRAMYLRNDISTPLSAIRRNSTSVVGAALSTSLGKTPEPYLASALDDINDEDLLALLLDAERNIELLEKEKKLSSEMCSEEVCEQSVDRSSITASSPYALPYTPSKLATPGKYLYLPRHLSRVATRARDSSSCMSDKFEWTHLRYCGKIELDAFFERLRHCSCLSFELVFRNIPVASIQLVGPQKKNNVEPLNIRMAWKQFITAFSPQATSKNVSAPSKVLSGICICMGGDVGYYLPLPTPLPLLQTNNSTELSSGTLFGRGKLRATIQSLPSRAKQLICRLVGFIGIVSYRERLGESINPLLSVSREWTALCRRELRLCWLKGHAMEWQILGQVMRSNSVTKVAIDMKRAALALRERDIFIDGPLEDPLIARKLLGESSACAIDLKIPATPAFGDARNVNLIQQCFRTVAVMRCMAAMEESLEAARLLDLFNNIEMPLIHSLVHAEFNGVRLNASLLSNLRAYLSDRERSIESVFREVMGESFNPSSSLDVAKLKAKCNNNDVLKSTVKMVQNDDEFCETQCSETANENHVGNVEHPLLQMISEYRSLIRMGPLCGSIWASRFSLADEDEKGLDDVVVRVRGTFDGLGTDTGRVIISSPPMQQMPHECRMLQPQRSNLHQELVSMGKQAYKMIASLHAKSRNGSGEEVKLIGMKKRDSSVLSFGRIIEIINVPISQCKVPMKHATSNACLVDEWRSAGHDYTDAEAASIATVRVEINKNIYFYPADKVIRILEGCYPVSDINTQFTECIMNPRDMFICSTGTILLAADYAQIELRLLAHFSQDPKLCTAFCAPGDIFRSLAAQWLNEADPSNVSDKDRKRVKQLCYALLYGAGPHKIASDAQCTVEEADKLIKDFLGCYVGIRTFIDSVKKQCRKERLVRTLLGRRRFLPEINSSAPKDRSRAERQAVNTLCQGSAADLIKLAMVNIHHRLKEQFGSINYCCRRSMPGGGLYVPFDEIKLVLQIHDELVFEIPQHQLSEVAGIVKHCMEHAVQLHVPLQVKLSVGESWGSLTEIDSVDTIKPVARNIFAE